MPCSCAASVASGSASSMGTPCVRCRWFAALSVMIVAGTLTGAHTPDPPIVVTASVDAREVRIGDRLTLAVSLEGPSAIARVRPVVGAVVGTFAMVELTAQSGRRTAGQFRQSWRLTLTTFEHGRQVIPRIVLEGAFDDGSRFSATTPAEIVITVAPPSATATDPLLPITSVIDLPDNPLETGARWLFWSVLLATGIVFAAPARARLLRWYRRRHFWRRLIAQAAALKGAMPPGTTRDQYTTATRLLRCGIGRLVDGTESLTPTEMAIAIAGLGARGAQVGSALFEVMSHLDEVRFGGSVPDDGMRIRALEEVVAMLRALRALSASSGGQAE